MVKTALNVLACVALCAAPAGAADLRFRLDANGDFRLFGNTVAHDCRNDGDPAYDPVVGTIGACGSNTQDSGSDIFWNNAAADSAVTPDQARSTAVLTLPAGARVRYARLYWAAIVPLGANPGAGVSLTGPGGDVFSIKADSSATHVKDGGSNAAENGLWYQSTADVTPIIAAQGVGAYGVSGIDSVNFVGQNTELAFAAWSMVVFFEDPAETHHRNLALFDGLAYVDAGDASANSTKIQLSGFRVPASGFDAKLGVVAYEGDVTIKGDALLFGGNALSDANNPIDNFFNGSRTYLGAPVSVAGDLPQAKGTPGTMSNVDLDVVDITPYVTAGQMSAEVEARAAAVRTGAEVFAIGAFATSITTFTPDLSASTKTFADLNGGLVLPGDVVEYTLVTKNSGNDAAVRTVLSDPLPPQVSYVPGSITLQVSTQNAALSPQSDARDGDQAEYDAQSRTVVARVGDGAGAAGGKIAAQQTITLKFRVTVNAGVLGDVANQAVINAAGAAGSPADDYETDGDPNVAGAQATVFSVDGCQSDADCKLPTPYCDTSHHPQQCVVCRDSRDCQGTTPVCDAKQRVCKPCAQDSDCPVNAPVCLPSGACGECTPSNTSACKGATPACNAETFTCTDGIGSTNAPVDAQEGPAKGSKLPKGVIEGGGFNCSAGGASPELLLLALGAWVARRRERRFKR